MLVVTVLLLGARQNIKKAIDFSFKSTVGEIYYFASSPQMKQDLKEAIESLSKDLNKKVKRLLADPAFKHDVKEATDFWYAYKYKKLEHIGKLGGT